MALYHISPTTGNPNLCRATGKRGCPYRTAQGEPLPHFESKEEARAAYERAQGTAGLPSLKKAAKERTAQGEGRPSYDWGKAETLGKLRALHFRSIKRATTKEERRQWLARQGRFGQDPDAPAFVAAGGYDHFPAYFASSGLNRYVTLSPEDPETQEAFTQGYCGLLAYELSHATGKPLAVFTGDDATAASWSGHVALYLGQDGEGRHRFLDLRGEEDEASCRKLALQSSPATWKLMEREEATALLKLTEEKAYGEEHTRMVTHYLAHQLLAEHGLLPSS